MKPIMENWRKFLLKEERFKAEARALSYLIKNTVFSLIKNNRLEPKKYEIYVPKSVFKNKNYNPTKVLNDLNKVFLDVTDTGANSKPIYTGAKVDQSENLIVELSLDVANTSKKDLTDIGWKDSELLGLLVHELTHVEQGASNTLKRYDLELKKDKKDESAWSKIKSYAWYFQSKIVQVFKYDNYVKQYEALLKEKEDDIKHLKSLMSSVVQDKEFILYFLQPIEIEAYANGFYSEARAIADREYERFKKYNNDAVIGPKRVTTKDELTRSFFEEAMKRQLVLLNKLRDQVIDWGTGSLADEDHQMDEKGIAIMNDAIEEYIEKVYSYAIERFPVLTR